MHILFIGYGKTSQRVAKQLFTLGHQITTISRSRKQITDTNASASGYSTARIITDSTCRCRLCIACTVSEYCFKFCRNVSTDLCKFLPSIVAALKDHPVKRIIVVSSTRVYGETQVNVLMMRLCLSPVMCKVSCCCRWNTCGKRLNP